MSGSDEDLDLLAGEYVLGCLDAAEMRRVEALAVNDLALQRALRDWSERLAPLGVLAPPVTPPDALWQRLEHSIGGTASVAPLRPRGTRLWRVATASALALAAAFAGIAYLRPATPPTYVAALAPVSAPAPAFLVRSEPDGALLVTPLSPGAVASGRDLELWALPQGAQRPVSLGVLPLGGRRIPPSDLTRPQTRILVSLEPEGGSPTGQPTGPVLYGGTLD